MCSPWRWSTNVIQHFRWYGRFREGRRDVQQDPRSGQPSDFRTDGNIKKVRQLLLQNRHLSLRMIPDGLGINKDTVSKAVTEDLKKGKYARSLYRTYWLQDRKRTELLYVRVWLRWKWSWLLQTNRNGRRIFVLSVPPSDETTIICMGWKKIAAATETSIPEDSCDDHVGDFLRLAGSRAQIICTGKTDCKLWIIHRSDGPTSEKTSAR